MSPRSWSAINRNRIAFRPMDIDRREFLRHAAAAGVSVPALSALVTACTRQPAAAEPSEEGVRMLAPTPPMGWNSWNVFGENIDEARILSTAHALVDSGMRDVGWEYVMLDDGWQKHRGSRFLYPLEHDPDKFPRGIASSPTASTTLGSSSASTRGPGLRPAPGTPAAPAMSGRTPSCSRPGGSIT